MRFPWSRAPDPLAEPFPASWLAILNATVPLYRRLPVDQQDRLRDDLRVFIAHKSWEGCRGLALTDEIRVTISAQACLLGLGFELGDVFPNVESILVYPAGYVAMQKSVGPGGVIREGPSARAGRSLERRPSHPVLAGRPGRGQELDGWS